MKGAIWCHKYQVRVDQGFRVAPVLGDLNGTLITVLLTSVDELKVGDQAIFLTSSWIHGKSIATRELAHLDATPTIEKTVTDAIALLPELQLQERIAGAELVVLGEVESITPMVGTQEPVSRHSPQWMVANIRVESVKKGTLDADHLRLVFPSSRDHMWVQAPKFKEGQQGIFFLHRGETPAAPRDAFTALERMDYQPREMLPNIEKFTESEN